MGGRRTARNVICFLNLIIEIFAAQLLAVHGPVFGLYTGHAALLHDSAAGGIVTMMVRMDFEKSDIAKGKLDYPLARFGHDPLIPIRPAQQIVHGRAGVSRADGVQIYVPDRL